MELTRVARTAKAVLEHTFYVGEDPTDSTTTVTYSVVDANGDTVTSGNAATAGVGTGTYTFTLPAQTELAELTVTWAGTIDGAAVVEQDTVEVVGGFFFSLKDAREADSTLSNTLKYPASKLATTRTEVEQECEEICAQAFVPRYRRVVLDGTGTSELLLPDPNVRTIRAVRVAPRVDGTFVALTTAQLAVLVERGDRVLRRTDGHIWTEGYGNVVVEYEHGLTQPPTDLVRVAKLRLRSRMNLEITGIPDRAVTFSASDGGTYRLSLPSAYQTGIPEVDAVYERYSLRPKSSAGGSSGAAGRALNFDPQRYSLFHGGER